MTPEKRKRAVVILFLITRVAGLPYGAFLLEFDGVEVCFFLLLGYWFVQRHQVLMNTMALSRYPSAAAFRVTYMRRELTDVCRYTVRYLIMCLPFAVIGLIICRAIELPVRISPVWAPLRLLSAVMNILLLRYIALLISMQTRPVWGDLFYLAYVIVGQLLGMSAHILTLNLFTFAQVYKMQQHLVWWEPLAAYGILAMTAGGLLLRQSRRDFRL